MTHSEPLPKRELDVVVNRAVSLNVFGKMRDRGTV